MMGEILVDVRKSRGDIVGRTKSGEQIKLSLPSPEAGLLGRLPDETVIPSPQYGEWIERMVREKILDNPPYPDYIHLNSAMILENGIVIIPYDSYHQIN